MFVALTDLQFCFFVYRLVYWFSLNTCSSWRGFGSGLTFFPLLAIVALNLFLMYQVYLKAFLSGSQDVLYNQVTPSPWSGETSHSPSGKPDILDAQWRAWAALSSLRGGGIFQNRPFLWSAIQHSSTRCHYNLQLCIGLTCVYAPPVRSLFMWICAILSAMLELSLPVAGDAFEQCCIHKTVVLLSHSSACV